jgi:hypothetical protein
MVKPFLYPLFLLLLLSACASAPSKQEMVQPTWVTNPPKDSPEIMWGVGEGSDLVSAKRSALKDVAAKLRVAISAQLESRVTVSSQSVDTYARSRQTEDVQRTEFKNYSLEKSASSGQNIYALVSVDRRAFIIEEEQKLVAAEKEIALRLIGTEKESALERFVAQQKALPWIEKAVASAQLLSAADATFDGNRARNYEAALAQSKSAASELTFDLKVKNDGSDVAQTIGNFLNESGMRIGGGGSPILISTVATQDVIFDSKTVHLRISLSILDAQGRSLASKEFTVHGSSMSDHRAARQAALKDLADKLREVGPLVALGFNPY